MKLLFYHYSMQSGGAERTISLLSNYMAECGNEVVIVTMDDKPSFYPLHPKVQHTRLKTARQSRNILDSIKNNISAIKSIKTVFSSFCPEVVVCFQPNTLLFSWLVRGGMGYRIIGSERANPYLWNQSLWKKAKKWISLCADGYLFQTRGAQSYYSVRTQKKSIILGNMIQQEEFTRREMDWSQRKNICAVGRMSAEKCFDDLLHAFVFVLERYPEVHLDLYGEGPLRRDLENLCIELGLKNAVQFCGRNDQILDEYAKHKIFVLTSLSEGMPNVLMEAMASGCACVSTDCDFGPSELIHDGENGLLVPVHDVNAIAARLCRLLEDDVLCYKLGQSAQTIRQTHDVHQIGMLFRNYIAHHLP